MSTNPNPIYVTTLDVEDDDEHHLAYTTYEAALASVQEWAANQPGPVRWVTDTQWECIDTATSMWMEAVEVVS